MIVAILLFVSSSNVLNGWMDGLSSNQDDAFFFLPATMMERTRVTLRKKDMRSLEMRVRTVSERLTDHPDWPSVGKVCRRTCRR